MSSKKRQAAADDGATEATDGRAPDATDNANYFCEYAYLYHQMDMLEDSARTGAYMEAITSNPKCFAGKVVLDVGAGSGILSIMAAQAGAKHVYAVEATDMAQRARKIVEANGLGDVITVLQGTVETVQLPGQVDVIVSEWMGYFLLRESMLDSVLVARDKFLRPGGSLFPSHATLRLAPVKSHNCLKERWNQWQQEHKHWSRFSAEMQDHYSVDYSCMGEEFLKEQRKYYLRTGAFVNLTPDLLGGESAPLLEIDLREVHLDDLKSPSVPARCTMDIKKTCDMAGFAGFFDTQFLGSPECAAEHPVTLDTAPQSCGTTTHWGQQLFGFHTPLEVVVGDKLECEMLIQRQKKNHRLLELVAKFTLLRPPRGSKPGAKCEVVKVIEDTFWVD